MHVHLSLGSNLGDRRANLRAALDALEHLPQTRVTIESHVFETDAWGVTDQPAFLNLVAEIETDLTPLELLNAVKSIERVLGREPGTRWGPRTIDLDIVLWEDTVLSTPELTIPHAEFRNRAFVLVPLAEIAPERVDPVSGRTVAELAARPHSAGAVTRVAALDH